MPKETPRNEANDEATTTPAPSARRAKPSGRRRTTRETATADSSAARPAASSEAGYDRPADEPTSDTHAESESMSPERHASPVNHGPSEEDIRVRAYLRYLERGGGHGLEFDDWVEAERELKTKK